MIYLIGKLVFFPELFADTAHVIAFPMGFALDRWLWGNRRRTT